MPLKYRVRGASARPHFLRVHLCPVRLLSSARISSPLYSVQLIPPTSSSLPSSARPPLVPSLPGPSQIIPPISSLLYSALLSSSPPISSPSSAQFCSARLCPYSALSSQPSSLSLPPRARPIFAELAHLLLLSPHPGSPQPPPCSPHPCRIHSSPLSSPISTELTPVPAER